MASVADTQLIARISVNSALPQLDRLFDYRVPEHLASLPMGARVKVPLRNSLVEGFVVELAELSDYPGKLLDIAELISPVPILQPEIYRLARAIANRQVGTVRDVLRLAIPARQARVEKAWLTTQDSDPTTAEQPYDFTVEQLRQRLSTHYDSILLDALDTQASRIALTASSGVVPAASGWLPRWSLDLAVIACLGILNGQSTIIAVPDFRDIEHLETALREFLPEHDILRLDSKQSNPERYRQYLACLADTPRVVIGNRSVLSAPVQRLGLIIVWDDSDPLHEEPLAPYPHSRDLALLRQQQSDSQLIFASYSPSIAVQRLVELNWLNPVRSRHTPPRVILPSGIDAERGMRIPSPVMQALAQGITTGPVLVQVSRPTASEQHYPDDTLPTAGQTAAQLGRAFPGVPVIQAEGDRVIASVSDRPALIIATRGAEPIAEHGYRAVALLDGLRMMGRESLNVAEDCLRWWSNAASLAATGAPVFLVGVSHELGQAMASWRQDRYAGRELAFRRELRLPPAIRTVTLSGHRQPVHDTQTKLSEQFGCQSLFLEPQHEADDVRVLVKFEYRDGDTIAQVLREEVIRYAAARGKLKPRLRVRMDEPELELS